MRRTWLALLLAFTMLLAACGDETEDVAEQPDTDDVEEADDPDDEPDAGEEDEAANGAATVALGDTDLGRALVDADGMTLYLFEPDEAGESTCYDDCAANWPPLIDDAPAAGDGVDEALLGTTEREDGSMQVTYDGWPLYFWIGDEAPGDAEGQGVNDVWWLVDADGAAIRDAGAADDDSAEEDEGDDGGGYGY